MQIQKLNKFHGYLLTRFTTHGSNMGHNFSYTIPYTSPWEWHSYDFSYNSQCENPKMIKFIGTYNFLKMNLIST
jgi:hypothetical protein